MVASIGHGNGADSTFWYGQIQDEATAFFSLTGSP